MSVWSAILESFHSALIDEINHKNRKLKPELGLPIRQSELKNPATPPLVDLTVAMAQVFGEPPGVVILALDSEAQKALGGASAVELWESVFSRVPPEFDRRKIRPRFGAPFAISSDFALPRSVAGPHRVIWIPFGIAKGRCYLAVGV